MTTGLTSSSRLRAATRGFNTPPTRVEGESQLSGSPTFLEGRVSEQAQEFLRSREFRHMMRDWKRVCEGKRIRPNPFRWVLIAIMWAVFFRWVLSTV
jgi:hypothetical protein